MVQTTLLLAPVVVLGVVLLLGFVGCDGWPFSLGKSNGASNEETVIGLEAIAPPKAGLPTVTAITDATFTIQGPPEGNYHGPDGEVIGFGHPPVTIQATMVNPTVWRAEITRTGPLVESEKTFTISPLVWFTIEEASGTTTTDANLDGPFDVEDSLGLDAWKFCVNYHPEGRTGGGVLLWQLEQC